jgi:hypothetical protein
VDWLPERERQQVEDLIALGVYEEVRLVEREDRRETLEVVDLQVDVDESFVAEGFVVHNSKICRFMHGRVFSVQRAIERFREVAAQRDPEEITSLQPWLRVGQGDTGAQALFFERGGRRHLVAQADGGESDEGPRFRPAMTNEELEAAGVTTPPLHGSCRSTVVPADEE